MTLFPFLTRWFRQPHRRSGYRQRPGVSLRFERLEERVVLAHHLGPVPKEPSIVAVQAGDSRVFVSLRHPDGTLGAPKALAARGLSWSPDSIGLPVPESGPAAVPLASLVSVMSVPYHGSI